MNEPIDPNGIIRRNGKVYQSIEDLPPDERVIFERLRVKLQEKYPGRDIDALMVNALSQDFSSDDDSSAATEETPAAWGGVGGIVVPSGFESFHSLGGVVQSYLAIRDNLWWQGGFGLGFFLIGLLLDGYFLASLLNREQFPRIDGFETGGTILLAVGGFLLIWPIQQILRRKARMIALVLYQDGFAYNTPSQIYSVAWREITSIFSHEVVIGSGNSRGTDRGYTLKLSNGSELSLSDDQFTEIREIMGKIKEKAYHLLLPPQKAAYLAGGTLTFGPVQISKTSGLMANGQSILWGDILNLSVVKGRLVVTNRDGKKFEVKSEKIPNLEILCQLIGIDLSSIDQLYR